MATGALHAAVAVFSRSAAQEDLTATRHPAFADSRTEVPSEGQDASEGKQAGSTAESALSLSWLDLSLEGASCMRWSQTQEKILLAPFDYLDAAGGSGIRERMMASFNEWLEVPEDKYRMIIRIIWLLQTASLLLDDVEDNSKLRRGVPVAHNIFGTAQCINSANYVCFLALQEVQNFDNPRIMDLFIEELLNLHRGQGIDIYWRDSLTCPTEEEYVEAARGKTGGLMRLAVKIMLLESEKTQYRQCVPLADLIGIIYQVYNDYVNLKGREYIETKGAGDDLTEGKFSLPIIHCVRTSPFGKTLLQILRQKTEDEDIKRYAIDCLEKAGSLDYTRRMLMALIEKAKQLLAEIDHDTKDGIGAILDRLVKNAS